MRGRLKIRIYRILKFLMTHLVRKEYRVSDSLFENTNPADRKQWVFYDERWDRIRHRFEDRKMMLKGMLPERNDDPQEPSNELKFMVDGTIEFDGKTESDDEWLYLYLDPERYRWDNYRMTFRFKRETDFRELQFGFRYQDFYNRYRYRFEDNRIFFDKVKRGKFYNGLSVTNFPMELGKVYKITIDVFDNRFRCFVDDKLMCIDYDFNNDFPEGSVAIILWENDSSTDIRGSLSSFQVRRLERK
jgi:hypothetical protein